MQHRLAAQIFSFLQPVFHPRLSLTSLWVLGTASSDRPCLNKMDSITLLEQKGCLAFHFSTNNWKLVYHVNKYKAIQYPTRAPSSSPFFPEYAPQEFLVTFHEKQPQAGCPFHPWPCGTFDVYTSAMMHLMPSMDAPVWPAHCLWMDVQAEGCRAWTSWLNGLLKQLLHKDQGILGGKGRALQWGSWGRQNCGFSIHRLNQSNK